MALLWTGNANTLPKFVLFLSSSSGVRPLLATILGHDFDSALHCHHWRCHADAHIQVHAVGTYLYEL